MSKVEFWSVLSAIALSFAVTSCAQQRQSAGPGGAEAATPMAAKTPQPEEDPCISCRIAPSGRVTGAWQEAFCRSDPKTKKDEYPEVAYPVSGVEIEVVEGEQRGARFPVESEGDGFGPPEAFTGQVGDGAAPKDWTTAYLWVTDASGRACYSMLAIDK